MLERLCSWLNWFKTNPWDTIKSLGISKDRIGISSGKEGNNFICVGCGQKIDQNGNTTGDIHYGHYKSCHRYMTIFVKLIVLCLKKLMSIFIEYPITERLGHRIASLWSIYTDQLFPIQQPLTLFDSDDDDNDDEETKNDETTTITTIKGDDDDDDENSLYSFNFSY